MLKKLTRNKKGFTLIELMIVIAIIGILAAIAIPNFIAYRDKSYCASVEQDCGNILASLSCYFSEPENLQCTRLTSLITDATCGFSLNNAIDNVNLNAAMTQYNTGNMAWWKVSVTDLSTRCPREMVYSNYMGTNEQGGWED